MPRGTTLATLLTMLKAEVGADLDSAVAPGGDSVMKSALSNQQKWLADTYDWPFLKKRVDIELVAETRYYTFPTTLNFDRPVVARIKEGANWTVDPVGFGITERHFQLHDSDEDVTADPVRRYDFDNSEATMRIEVWPIPASAQTLRFIGQRTLNALTSDAHTADIDDLLLVYYSAAELLAGKKQGEAKLAKAQARMNQLRGSSPSQYDRFILGGNIYRKCGPRLGMVGVSGDQRITADNDTITIDSD